MYCCGCRPTPSKMPVPPPQSFVRRQNRRAKAALASPPYQVSMLDTNEVPRDMQIVRSMRGESAASAQLSPRTQASYARTAYNRFAVRSIHQALGSQTSLASSNQDDLEWILLMTQNIHLASNQISVEYLREQIAMMMSEDEDLPPTVNILMFPDQNEHCSS